MDDLDVIHLFALSSGNSEFTIESFGIEVGKYHTYVTHALVHASLFHIIGNSLGLLAFGAVVEQQMKWYWFVAAVVGGVLAGAIAGVVFPYRHDVRQVDAFLQIAGTVVWVTPDGGGCAVLTGL